MTIVITSSVVVVVVVVIVVVVVVSKVFTLRRHEGTGMVSYTITPATTSISTNTTIIIVSSEASP